MSEAERLNAVLARETPALFRCLSPLGRRAAFPKGIPYQSAAAKGTSINATIGQMTDGHGNATPLSVLTPHIGDLDPKKTFLYAPVQGHADVADLWRAREQRLAGSDVAVSRPVATHGLTHGLSLLAQLFADEDTTLVVPEPFWGNYRLIFTMQSGLSRIETFPFFDGDGFNLAGLEQALGRVRGKAILVLNLPGNPTGYALTPQEARDLLTVVDRHREPLVLVVDDAYEGFVYEEDRLSRSIFWDLAERLDPERQALVKVDGATKELLFFGSRVGYLTHPHVQPDAEAAVLSKLMYLIRGTVGPAAGPSQELVLRALQAPGLDQAFAEQREVLARRYRALKTAIEAVRSDRLVPYPFNAAFFMLMRLPGIDVDRVRRRLIDEESVGTIAFADHQALRVAHCSVDEASIPAMVERISRVVHSEPTIG
jgi:aspartate/methionine/tyrosine aminotransferase